MNWCSEVRTPAVAESRSAMGDLQPTVGHRDVHNITHFASERNVFKDFEIIRLKHFRAIQCFIRMISEIQWIEIVINVWFRNFWQKLNCSKCIITYAFMLALTSEMFYFMDTLAIGWISAAKIIWDKELRVFLVFIFLFECKISTARQNSDLSLKFSRNKKHSVRIWFTINQYQQKKIL